MKKLTAAITTALGVGVFGCGGSAHAAGANYTVYDYIIDNRIVATDVFRDHPGSPTINLPVPGGWHVFDYLELMDNPPYALIELIRLADPVEPATIQARVTRLTGDVDPAKIIEYAAGEVKNLPGYHGGDGIASTLSGFHAWQISGSYSRDGQSRVIAQKTVAFPSQGGRVGGNANPAVFVLRLKADAPDSERGPLMDAANIIFNQTTVTP